MYMNNVNILPCRLVRFSVSVIVFTTVFLLCTLHYVRAGAIAIDGKFGDWDQKVEILVDPVDAEDGFVDLGSIRYASDGHHLHLMLELRRTVNLQAMDGQLTLYFDADGDVTTGRTDGPLLGADLAIVCTAPTNRHIEAAGMGLAVEVYHRSPTNDTTWHESPYTLGISFAPTIASPQSELRIERGVSLHDRTLFAGKKVTMRIIATTAVGDVVDAIPSLTLHLPELETTPWKPANEVSLERMAGNHLRVITWNVKRGSILNTPLPFVRTLRALDADIILLEELTSQQSQHTIETFFNNHCPLSDNARWYVHLGSGGGNLRCAIVSSFPFKAIDALDTVPYENQTNRSVRQASCIVNVDDTNVFVCAIHLKCCGRVNSREEVTRLTEVRSLINAIAASIGNQQIDVMILGGDVNLVGGHAPLTNLIEGCNRMGHQVQVVDAYQLDGRTNATWYDADQPFVPGRLDYLLCSVNGVTIEQSFVFDATDLPQHLRSNTGILPTDSLDASDHRPVVVDLRLDNSSSVGNFE